MFFKIVSAHDCLAIRLDKVDVVRLEYNDSELDDIKRHIISMYQADQATPVALYDVTKLSLDRRHELFTKLVTALGLREFTDVDSYTTLLFDCR